MGREKRHKALLLIIDLSDYLDSWGQSILPTADYLDQMF